MVHSLAKQAIHSETLPFWRNRWTQLIAEVETLRKSYNSHQQMAQNHLKQGNGEEALEQALQLPDHAPWGEAKAQIVAEAQRQAQDNNRYVNQQSGRLVGATIIGGLLGFIGSSVRR